MKMAIFVLATLSVLAVACSSPSVKPQSEEEIAEWRRERMMHHHSGRLGM